MIIVPTPGRIVWYRPNSSDLSRGPSPGDQPLPAIVTHVHDDRLVDLHVFPCGGGKLSYGLEKIKLLQEGDAVPTGDARYAQWMPYQTKTAKGEIEPTKHDQKVKP
jgi:hypothetical protein